MKSPIIIEFTTQVSPEKVKKEEREELGIEVLIALILICSVFTIIIVLSAFNTRSKRKSFHIPKIEILEKLKRVLTG